MWALPQVWQILQGEQALPSYTPATTFRQGPAPEDDVPAEAVKKWGNTGDSRSVLAVVHAISW